MINANDVVKLIFGYPKYQLFFGEVQCHITKKDRLMTLFFGKKVPNSIQGI